MIIQNIVFPDAECAESAVYFHTDGKISSENNTVFLKEGEYFSSYAYMNVLDIGFWKKYTDVRDITLRLFAVGKGELKIYIKNGEDTAVYKELEYGAGQTDIDLSDIEEGLVYFSLAAKEASCLLKAFYSSAIREPNEVRIAAAAAGISGRLKEVSDKLGGSLFFKQDAACCGKLKVYCAEGGFEGTVFDSLLFNIRQDQENFRCTHIVFMTDEGDFCEEGLYRLYAFFSMVKEEYKDRPVSGRIFYSDKRSVVYSSCEKWNGSDIIHSDGGLDVALPENIAGCGAPYGDYGLWRLCAYPAQYPLSEKPFAFYGVYTDAEYGLRYGKKPLVIRGFEAFGGAFEKEKLPEDIYYEARNGLVLDMMESYEADAFPVLERWNAKYRLYKEAGDSKGCFGCALALLHASRPGIFRKKGGKAPKKTSDILKRKRLLKPACVLVKWFALAYIYTGYSFFRDRFTDIRRKQTWQ